MNEREIIRYSHIPGLSVFFNTLIYRTPHFHPEFELIWVLKNQMTVTLGSESLHCTEDDILLFSGNRPHEMKTCGDSCTFLCLQVQPDILSMEDNSIFEELYLNAHFSDRELWQMKEKLLGIMRSYLNRERYEELYCRGQVLLLFHQIFSRIPTRKLTPPESAEQEKQVWILQSLIRYVDKNYMHRCTLSDFSESVGFSKSYMSHFIKSAINQSFTDYVNSVRTNCACKLMADGNLKLTEISYEAGFSDYRYFSNSFKNQFSMTPEQYRLSIKKPETDVVHRSIHSLEHFYTEEQSIKLLEQISVSP